MIPILRSPFATIHASLRGQERSDLSIYLYLALSQKIWILRWSHARGTVRDREKWGKFSTLSGSLHAKLQILIQALY